MLQSHKHKGKFLNYSLKLELLKVTRRSENYFCIIFDEVRGETDEKISSRTRLRDNLVI